MNEKEFIETIFIIYFLAIPLIYNLLWQETKISFIKWYFTKSECSTYFGYILFFIIGMGSFIWLFCFYISNILFDILYKPLSILLKFLFVRKCKDNLK